MRRVVGTVFVLLFVLSAFSRASITLLLEEPYGKLGFFTARVMLPSTFRAFARKPLSSFVPALREKPG
jgi:hypothetical protein